MRPGAFNNQSERISGTENPGIRMRHRRGRAGHRTGPYRAGTHPPAGAGGCRTTTGTVRRSRNTAPARAEPQPGGPAGARRGRAAGKHRRRNRATYSGLRRTLLSGACLTRAASNPIQPARRLRAHPAHHARGRARAGERAAVPLAHERKPRHLSAETPHPASGREDTRAPCRASDRIPHPQRPRAGKLSCTRI